MTVFARSDVAAVSISPAHGGCGDVHSRPVVGGAPSRVWALTCHSGCEDVLRRDTLWSATPTTIPETPDEINAREDAEKRGQVEQMQNTAAALQDLAKLGDLPSAIAQLAQMMTGQRQLPEATIDVMCKHGHRNPQTARFCGECGVSMQAPVGNDRGKSLTTTSVKTSDDFDSRSLNDLRTLAKDRGLDIGRTKKEQINILRGGTQ